MGVLVFVSTELSPFTPGGIGRAIHNILREMGPEDRARTVVLLLNANVNPRTFNALFPGAKLLSLDTTKDLSRHENGRRLPPAWAYSDTQMHWQSACVMQALQELHRETAIDYVEFPDWGGLAFCTLQERRFNAMLSETCIAVRLHSTHLALLNAEARSIQREDLNIADLERKCLRDCDRVVAQLPRMANVMRDLMAFQRDEWDHRVVVHAPPIVLDHHETVTQTCAPTPSQTIVFASKIQRVKRPDLFVRGASAFMRAHSDYIGSAVLNAIRDDSVYSAAIENLIPTDLNDRFISSPSSSSIEREELISRSTVVVPSDFESFCLAAYEASLLGARLILNGRNPAFDDASPWIDGINCYKFDGTASGLAQTLARSFAAEATLAPITVQRHPWPWDNCSDTRLLQNVSEAGENNLRPKVSFIVPHFNLGEYLCETLENILATTYPNIEVIVIDDASTQEPSIETIAALGRVEHSLFKLIRLHGNVGLAAARNIGIRHATGEYILTLDADDFIDPRFVGLAVGALERNTGFDVVITPAAYFNDGEEPPMQGQVDAVDYAVFSGEAKAGGLLENRFSTATALFRKTVFDRFPYCEDLHCFEDWSLYMRLCDAGTRFIVTTDAFFFYRRRLNSMVNAPRQASIRLVEYADLLRTSAPAALRLGSQHLMVGLASPVTHAHDSPFTHVPGENSDEILRRILHLDQLLTTVTQATTPLLQLFRIPRYVWRRLLPFRRLVARIRTAR